MDLTQPSRQGTTIAINQNVISGLRAGAIQSLVPQEASQVIGDQCPDQENSQFQFKSMVMSSIIGDLNWSLAWLLPEVD